ncbi:hypothetical protein OS493_010782 [Desmophyllum pertusum]|uniref:Uncharacterized protein n=1 Tax=Desmophyllum pertusum TaxID=174260 RepID=A0A9W9ZFK8_9CNID|nr:hypothetical protein OS493_010782 [Desmophyllum pertusum]
MECQREDPGRHHRNPEQTRPPILHIHLNIQRSSELGHNPRIIQEIHQKHSIARIPATPVSNPPRNPFAHPIQNPLSKEERMMSRSYITQPERKSTIQILPHGSQIQDNPRIPTKAEIPSTPNPGSSARRRSSIPAPE